MPDNAIIDKLKKLLRLSKSSNPHEAELAMQRAMELAAKHRIDLDSVDPNDDGNQVMHDHTKVWSRMPLEALFAMRIVNRFFGVRCIQRTGFRERVAMIGRKSEVEIALYVFSFLVGHFRRCWNKRENRRLKRRDAFMEGMFEGLWLKLLAAQPSDQNRSTALVNRYQTYVDQYFGPLSKGKPWKNHAEGADSARSHGFHEGANTNIRPAVHNAQEQAGRLLK